MILMGRHRIGLVCLQGIIEEIKLVKFATKKKGIS